MPTTKTSKAVKHTLPSKVSKAKKRHVSSMARRHGKVCRSTPSSHLQFPAAKRRAIMSALKDADEVPEYVKELLANWTGRCSDLDGHEEAVAMLGSIMDNIDISLQRNVCDLQNQLDNAEPERAKHAAELLEAASEVARLKESICTKKAAVQNASKVLSAAAEAHRSGQSCQKAGAVELKAATKKYERLEAAKLNVYGPLRVVQAKGNKGRAQLKDLRRVGKEFGFHEVLLSAMPAVLTKKMDRRQTFDAVAIEQFDSEFGKHLRKLEATASETRKSFEDTATAVAAAQQAVLVAKEERERSVRELAAAEEELATGMRTLEAAKLRVQEFPKNTKRSTDALNRAQAQLAAFRTGPLDAFEELKIRLLPGIPDACEDQVLAKEPLKAAQSAVTPASQMNLDQPHSDTARISNQAVASNASPNISALWAAATLPPIVSGTDATDAANQITQDKQVLSENPNLEMHVQPDFIKETGHVEACNPIPGADMEAEISSTFPAVGLLELSRDSVKEVPQASLNCDAKTKYSPDLLSLSSIDTAYAATLVDPVPAGDPR